MKELDLRDRAIAALQALIPVREVIHKGIKYYVTKSDKKYEAYERALIPQYKYHRKGISHRLFKGYIVISPSLWNQMKDEEEICN